MLKRLKHLIELSWLSLVKTLTTSREDIKKEQYAPVIKTGTKVEQKKENRNGKQRKSTTKSSNGQNTKVKRGNDTRRKVKGSKKL